MSRDSYIYRERKGTAGAPLVFAFHGTGGDENQLFELALQMLPEAHVVSPRGDVSEGGALRFFRRTGEGVYDMDDLALRTRRMAEFIGAIAEEVPAARVLGFGYSNGANILASVLLQRPELLDAAALLHPLIPFKPPAQPALAGKRILITAGRHDPICPPVATEALGDYFQAQAAEVSLFWHQGGHEVGPGELEAVRAFLAAGTSSAASLNPAAR